MLLWVKLIVLVLLGSSAASILASLLVRFMLALRRLYRTPDPPRFWNSMRPAERLKMLTQNGESNDYINRVASSGWWELPVGDRAVLRDAVLFHEYLLQAEKWNRLKAAISGTIEDDSISEAVGLLVVVAWLSVLFLAFYNPWRALVCAVGLLAFIIMGKKRVAEEEPHIQQSSKPVQLEITDEDIPF